MVKRKNRRSAESQRVKDRLAYERREQYKRWERAMCLVPVGGVFLVEHTDRGEPTTRVLYQRIAPLEVACRVTSTGHLRNTTAGISISRADFSPGTKIVRLPDVEQARRLMLVAHKLGHKAIEPYEG